MAWARSGCCLQAAVVNGTCVQHLRTKSSGRWPLQAVHCFLNDEARRWRFAANEEHQRVACVPARLQDPQTSSSSRGLEGARQLYMIEQRPATCGPHPLRREAIFKGGAACPASCTEPRCSLLKCGVHNRACVTAKVLCFRHRLTVRASGCQDVTPHIVNRKRLLSVWDSGLEARSGCCEAKAVVNSTCVQQNEIWSMATSSCALLRKER
jgi:hypothetical protein